MILTQHGINSMEMEEDNTITYGSTTIGGYSFDTAIIHGKAHIMVTMPDGKTWLGQNLDYKFKGCDISTAESPITGMPSTPTAWYYNNNESEYGIDSAKKCGLLYNSSAVDALNEQRAKLIPGWHVPSYDEWESLFTAINDRGDAGKKLKAVSNFYGNSWPDSTWGGTSYTFLAIPSGYYNSMTGSLFNDIGYYGYIWDSTHQNNNINGTHQFIYGVDSSGTEFLSSNIRAHSIRLVRD